MKNLLLFSVIICLDAFAQDSTITPGSNLVTEGIPSIPAFIASQVKPYLESRSAALCTWHPQKREIVISTRFGNVPQLHSVKMPLGYRKQFTFFDEPITNAAYEPTRGNYLLFTKDIGGNEFSQIYRYTLKNGSFLMLTDGKRSQNGGIVWSNNGKWIAYRSTRRNGADGDIYIMNPENPATDTMLLQLKGGGWYPLDWAKDDKQLLLMEYISINESYYWLVDKATATKKELTDRSRKSISNGKALFSKDGRGIYFITDRDNEFARLAYMDLLSKKVSYLTSSIPWNVEEFDLSKDGKQLAFVTNEAGISKLFLMNTRDKHYNQVQNLPVGVYSSVNFHNNGRDLAVSVTSAKSPSDVYVITTTTNKVERWTESEMGGIIADQLNTPSLIKWKSFDGKEISGFYYQPSKKSGGKRPVIISIHGGPESQARPAFQGANNYYLNELGVAMILPNVRGSSGYGKTFLASDNGMKREESVKDIGALLDWIARQPELDTSRVMVTGGSYGGYMALAVAAGFNDRIRCAVDIVGISNFNTFLKNTESYRRDLRRAEYGDERDTAMYSFFEKIAPLNNAGKITRPLFIIQGGNDPRVPRTEALQMAQKVKGNGSVVWYLEAKDEGHGFRKKNNIDFQRYATILFINKYLLAEGDSAKAGY